MYISLQYWLWCLAGVSACLLLVLHEHTRLPDGQLHLHVLDVGQGDSILMVTPSGKQVLIDGGPDVTTLERLDRFSFFDRRIELLILTHPDADHITALPEIVKRYEIGHVLVNGAQHRSGRNDAFLVQLKQSAVPILVADPARDIDLGDGVVLDVLWPDLGHLGVVPDDANNPSVVVKVYFKDHRILLAGDIEVLAEEGILATGADLSASILKVPHHGSRTSSSTGFLLAVDPDVALISAGGADSRFGHPHTDVVRRYEQMGIAVRRTDKEGTISLVFE